MIDRMNYISKSFLSPTMENLPDLGAQISDIWAQLGSNLTNSAIRVGTTAVTPYADRISSSTIPDEGATTEEIIQHIGFYMQGLLKWNSPGVMVNVNPPAMTLPIAASACCSWFNPNLAMDVPAGNLAFAELEVVKMLSDLVQWDYRRTGGFMTFGGKGTVLYAIRMGLMKCCPEARSKGMTNLKVKVFSTDQGHPCHYEDCEWLGIGRENCERIQAGYDGRVNLDELRTKLWQSVEDGYRIACIIANGGSTLYTTVDDIAEIVRIRNELVGKFHLEYIPHVHVDSVIGWAWLMFNGYDFDCNELGFSPDAVRELRWVLNALQSINLADSYGADFHKTGYAPYLCSTIICRDKQWLYALGDENQAPLDQLQFGLYAPFTYTLESSRPAVSALSAWISLKLLGRDGYRRIIGTLVESGCDLRSHFDQAPYGRCQNLSGHGFAALVMMFPQELRQYAHGDLSVLNTDQLLRLAKYNHKLYLYMLSLQAEGKLDFALDYVAKQTEINDIQIGVIKLYPMSPFCTLAYLSGFYQQFEALLVQYDQCWETIELKDSPYRPKPFVTR